MCEKLCPPVMPGCSCGLLRQEGRVYACEVIFTYCLQEQCSLCPLPNMSSRTADTDAVMARVAQAAETARAGGYDTLFVRLIGGDSFTAWEALKKLCGQLWSQSWGLEIRVGLTLCARPLSREMRLWVLEHKQQLTMTLRLNSELGRRLWKEEILARHPVVGDVCLCLARRDIPFVGQTLLALAKARKTVSIEAMDAESWCNEDRLAYSKAVRAAAVQALKRYKTVLFPRAQTACLIGESRAVVTIDVDGTVYPCRYCSPERMVYSTLRQRLEPFAASESPCPAAELQAAGAGQAALAIFHRALAKALEEAALAQAGGGAAK